MKLIFVLFTLIFPLIAIPINKQIMMDISKTYGYYQGQQYMLNIIKRKYPKLSNKVFIAQNEFNLSFLESIKNIDRMMSRFNEWKSVKEDIEQNLNARLNLSNLTYNEALNFIKTVKKRAKGNIQSPIIETLLIFNPNYQKNPEQEFYDGFRKRYRCDDLEKSKGVDFEIDIPMSWKSKKANRPDIVRKFISQNGHSAEMVMILVYNSPDGKYLSANNIDEKYMQEILPPNAILKDYGSIKLETLPGFWQKYSMKIQRIRKIMTIEMQTYTIFYKDKLIQIQFQVIDSDNKILKKRFKKFEPLFDAIINSFVILNLYK